MANQPVRRRLAAILAADVAGYTRQMERDTEGTVATWKTARDEAIEPVVASHSGRIVKFTGDGFLAEFPTVQDAVRSAIALQAEFATRNGPRKLDSALSEIFLRFQATNLTLA